MTQIELNPTLFSPFELLVKSKPLTCVWARILSARGRCICSSEDLRYRRRRRSSNILLPSSYDGISFGQYPRRAGFILHYLAARTVFYKRCLCRLTATSTLRSSRDKDPWGQVSSVPTPASAHYKLLQTVDINLIRNCRRPPFAVASIWVDCRGHHTLNLLSPMIIDVRSSPSDAKVEVAVRI